MKIRKGLSKVVHLLDTRPTMWLEIDEQTCSLDWHSPHYVAWDKGTMRRTKSLAWYSPHDVTWDRDRVLDLESLKFVCFVWLVVCDWCRDGKAAFFYSRRFSQHSNVLTYLCIEIFIPMYLNIHVFEFTYPCIWIYISMFTNKIGCTKLILK